MSRSSPSASSAQVYRLKLKHKSWPRPAHTKWQESQDFRVALTKATEHGISAQIQVGTVVEYCSGCGRKQPCTSDCPAGTHTMVEDVQNDQHD